MPEREKSNIQKAVDLLEEAGFHVTEAVEEQKDFIPTGYTNLRIHPVDTSEN